MRAKPECEAVAAFKDYAHIFSLREYYDNLFRGSEYRNLGGHLQLYHSKFLKGHGLLVVNPYQLTIANC